MTNTLKFARLVLTALCVCYGLLFSQVAFSQASSSPVLFSTTNIGSTSAAQAVTFTFSGSSTLASISVLTQGVGGLDFASAAGGNCTAGTSYTAGNSCTVNVTFTPTAAGNRYGAVVLAGAADQAIATGYLQGTGAGPQVNFLPGTEITVPASALNFPYGVAVDGAGDVYIVDSENNRVLKETLSGGSFTESTVSTSSLNDPMGIAVDGGGSIYIADSGNNRILKESPSGSSFTESTVPTSALSFASGVAVDGSGDVYVADWGNNRVLMENLSEGSYTESTVPTSSLNGPAGVAVDGGGDVYIVDTDNQRILKETLAEGTYTESTVSTSALYYPGAISVDDNGNIYIADTGNNRILKESPSGTSYIESTIATSNLNFPSAVTVDGSGNVYIADTGDDRVLKEDLADPPSLGFAPTAPGATSSDSPQTVTLENVGSTALSFPVPTAGSNPGVAANFALNSSGGSACPLVSSGSSSAGSLAAGQSCLLPISFTPTAAGTFSGVLALTDNALNAPAPAYAAQNIQLNGIGTGSTDQTITFDSMSAQTANSTGALSATASSGLPVTFSSNSPSICAVSGSVATLLTAGTCGIVASQPGNATYEAASPVTQSFGVNLASQTITFTAIPSQILNTSVAIYLSASASSGLPVSFTSTTSTVCTVFGSTVTLLASGTCGIEATQSGNATFAAATPVTQSFTITSVTLPANSNFGSVNIGATSGAQSVTFTFAGSATLGNISVLTMGAPGLDFANGGTGTCTVGTGYASGNSCTVNVTFRPAVAGARKGAVILQDNSGNAVATGYLQGIGTGPQLNFLPGVETVIPTSNLNGPYGVAEDGAGNVYISDTYNNRVLKETPSEGEYSESVIPTSALSWPAAIAVDGGGNLYIADTYNNRVLEEKPSDSGYAESTISTSTLAYPFGVAVDSGGNVYIADTYNNRVLLETLSGGSYTETVVPTSSLSSPLGVSVDGSGNVYIADTNDNRIIMETLSGNGYAESTVPTSTLYDPGAVAVDGLGDVFIADTGNNRVLKETLSSGAYVETVIPTSSLNYPSAVTVDDRGYVYITDTANDRLLQENFTIPPSLNFADTAPGSTSSDSPKTITLENAGNANLTLPAPGTGANPAIPANFTVNGSESGACPLVSSGSSAGTLAAGQSCLLTVSFAPTVPGTFSGAVVATDNALNAVAPEYATQSFSVRGVGTGAAAQTISFGPIGAQTATSSVALAATATSGLPVIFSSTSSGICAVTGSTATLLTAGTCGIEASQVGNASYQAATPVTQSFSVNLASQTISFEAIPTQVINTVVALPLNATASSGLPVVFSSATPAVCTVSGAMATLLSEGGCSINSSQPGNSTFAAAATVTQSFSVESINPQTGTNFGSVNIGTASAAQTVTISFSAAETLGSIAVLTEAITGLDFSNAGTGTCIAGIAYSSGSSCTVRITFTPGAAGERYGAVVLSDDSGKTIATNYLQGIGVGPQLDFLPGAESIVPTSSLNNPSQIAVDGQGSIYIADSYNNRILKEGFSQGIYKEITIPTSALNTPFSVAVDASDNLYVADTGNNRVLKEMLSAGGYQETVLATSALASPSGVTVDGSGNVYIADTGNNRVLIEMLSSGGYTETTAPTSTLQLPQAVAVDANGNLYIADTFNDRILKETLARGSYTESTVPTSPLYYPEAIAVDGVGNVYIADTNNGRVLKEAPSGSGYTETTVPAAALAFPSGVSADGAGNVYISDSYNQFVLKEEFANPPSLSFALTAPGATSSDSPQTVTLQNTGNAVLSFPVPGSGTNPSVASNFALNSSGASACPLVSAGSSSAGTLAAGQSCLLPVSFTPSATGALHGTLAITDNALNASGPVFARQSTQLTGGGTGNTTQTITFASISAQTATSTVALLATASSGLSVTFNSMTSSVCTVSGSTATLEAAGTCTIQASQPGNSTYAPASPVDQSFTVNPAPQTITFPTIPSQAINAEIPVLLTAFSSASLPVSYTSSTPAVCAASTVNQTAALLTAGTCTIEASQSGNGTYAAAATVVQSFTVQSASPLAASNFGSVNIGTTSTPKTETFTFSGAETLGDIVVLTQGVTGIDFANAASGSCTSGDSYTVGSSCTVIVTFHPTAAGTRDGAVVLDDTSGNPIGIDYLQGNGSGPEVNFAPGAESTIPTSSLADPSQIAIDGAGSIYIADTYNNRILKETLADGSFTEATIPTSSLGDPAGVAVDASGKIYIADTYNNRVLIETPTEGSYSETTLPTSSLSGPSAVAADGGGNVYIADSGNNRILLEALSADGYAEVTVPTSGLQSPQGVAVDGAGDIFVADSGNNRVLKETPSGTGYSETVVTTSSLNYPVAVAVDGLGNLYIADSGNNRVLKESTTTNGGIESAIPTSSLNYPSGVAVDAKGNVYIDDSYNNRILEEDFADPPTLAFATTAPGYVSSDSPQAVTLENVGNAAMSILAPSEGNNPSVTANFALNSTGTSACPLINAGSSAGTLGAGQSCSLPISFAPTASGTFTGSVVMLDNALYSDVSQTIGLSGVSSGTRHQTITFHSVSTQTVNESVALSASASSGLPVTFTSTTPTICSVSGSTAATLAPGTCSIQATQSGNVTYAPATPVIRSFTVDLATQTITFTSISTQALNTSVSVPLSAEASSGLPVQFSTTTPTVCTVSGSSALLLAVGTCKITAAQPGDGVTYAAARSVTDSFSVKSVSPLPSVDFGTVSIGTASASKTVTFTLTAADTLGTISVLTAGGSGLDFANLGTGTCAVGTSYSSGSKCTVKVKFTPAAAGARYGAITLLDKSGNIIATTYLEGIGAGPHINFLPGTESTIPTSSLSDPAKIAVDGTGNIYIADTYNNRILKESVSGSSFTESTIPTSTLRFPSGVSVDGAGNVYVADSENNRILQEALAGSTYVESVIATSPLNNPSAVVTDGSGNIYIADTGNARILVEMKTSSGFTEAIIPTSSLNYPSGLAVDGAGDVYIADSGNARLLKESLSESAYSEVTVPTSALSFPEGVAVDGDGNLYLVDSGNNRVLMESLAGDSYTESVIPTSSLSFPGGIAVDSKDNVYVSDTYNQRVLKEDLSDPPSLTFALTVPGTVSSDSPQTVAVENTGNTALSFPVLSSGNNPRIASNFSLNSSGSSACPLVTSGSSSAGTLAAGETCLLPISFVPTASGTFSGNLALTDNSLNAAAPGYAVQDIQLNGTGSGSTSQTITFASISAQTANSTVSLTATASSGLPVTFSSTTPGICTVSGSTATLLAAGSCSIVVNQAGSAQYAAAPPVTQTFTVNFASQTISFASIPTQIVNASVALTASASSGLPVSFNSTTPTVCTASTANSNATLLTAGTCTIEATQSGDGVVYAAGPPVSQSFTVESVSAQASANFGSVDVGTTSPSQPLTVTFATAETIGSISVVTQGATGLDFANAGTGSCAVGTGYTEGNSCTVNVTFTPIAAGVRYGAVILQDNSGNLIAVSYVQGIGAAPEVNFLPGTEITVPTGGMSSPYGVAVDATGSVYIADSVANQVLKETLSAGSYTQTIVPTSSLNAPAGVAVDGSGAIYLADSHNNRILKETPSGSGYVETTVPTSTLSWPTGLAVDGNGNVYIADSLNGRVLVEMLSGSGYSEVTIPTGYLYRVEGVTVDGGGNVYIAVAGEGLILKEALSAGGYTQSVVASSLNYPEAVGVDGQSNIYVTDTRNNRVLKFASGTYIESVVSTSALNSPDGVALDGRGNIYIADSVNDRVLEEDLADPPSLSFATTAPGSTSSDSPKTVTLENVGNAALAFPIPASGNNPSIATNFTLGTGAASDCPLATAGSSWSGTLGVGESCALPVSFTPTTTGTISGGLVLTDNTLNAATPNYVTQTIPLSGTGSGNTQNVAPRPLEACNPSNTGGLPTITSISPLGWFPGQTNLTVVVTGNLTGNDTIPGCDYVEDYIFPINSSTSSPEVQILSATVINQKQVALTVSVSANAKPGLYQLSVSCDGCDHSAYATIPVLPTPLILDETNNNAVISGVPELPPIMTGQLVDLTTNVVSAQLNAEITNLGAILLTNFWTADGTTVGDYDPYTGGAPTLTPTVFDHAELKMYWLYPGQSPLNVKYSYCVFLNELGLTGSVCSPPAVVTRTVQGVSGAAITPQIQWETHIDPLLGCYLPDHLLPPALYLEFGHLKGFTGFCGNGSNALKGIKFNVHGTTPNGYTAGFVFGQVRLADVSITLGAKPCSYVQSGVGDGPFPYLGTDKTATPVVAYDAPANALENGNTIVARAFTARMYLLWKYTGDTGSVTPSAIPVPLGYVDWTWIAGASPSASSPLGWAITPPLNGGTAKGFVASNPQQEFLGVPMWSAPVEPDCIDIH